MSSSIWRVSTIAAVLVACSSDTHGVTTGPPPPLTVSQLQIMSGSAQAGKPGAVLAESLVVRAVTSTGKPVAGVGITWTTTTGSGTLSPVQSTTDSSGRAAVQWTLGQGSVDSATARAASATATFAARTVTPSSPLTWTVEASGTTHNINAVWGSSGTNVYAVGDSGAFLHYDGTSWSQVQSSDSLFQALVQPYSYPSLAIWGTSATDVYVAADDGELIHFDGQHWTLVPDNYGRTTGLFVTGIWGDSPNDVWIATYQTGMNVTHFDGSQWSQQNMPPLSSGSHSVYCPAGWMIAGTSSTNVYMFDHCGALNTFNGTTWSVETSNIPNTMSALWGVPGGAIYAIGIVGTGSANPQPRGVYVASGPTSWTLVPGSPTLPQTDLASGDWISSQNGLWASASNDLFAVVDGTMYHYNGSTWTTQSDASWHGWAMYGASLTDIFVVGPKGFILHGRR